MNLYNIYSTSVYVDILLYILLYLKKKSISFTTRFFVTVSVWNVVLLITYICIYEKQSKDYLFYSDGESKVDKFQLLLEASVLNLDELRQLSWSGVPAKLRSVTWRLLSVSSEGKT